MSTSSNLDSSTTLVLTPETPPRLCARQLILARVIELAQHEAGTRAGEDIEALHDMRVASRRLREALEIFEFCFPPKIYARLYERVRRVTRALGRARDADVMVAYFSALLSAEQDLIEQFTLHDMLRRLARQQNRRRAEMQNELDKVQPAELLPRFEKAFAAPSSPRGPRTALFLTRRLSSLRLREVFTCRRAIKGETDVEGLHNLRLAVKKLRYALETLDFAAGEHVKENLKFFKKLQTALGELHDRDVFHELARTRLQKLEKQSFAGHLLKGYGLVSAKIAMQRQDFYVEYQKIFGNAHLQDWRARVVPPPPARTRVVPTTSKAQLQEADTNL